MKKIKILLKLIVLIVIQNYCYAQIIESAPGSFTIDEGCGPVQLTQAPFSGVAAVPLCEIFENIEFDLVVGVGSPSGITHSSQLPNDTWQYKLAYKKVHVVGNFTIDGNHNFLGCKFKIDPGQKITVANTAAPIIDGCYLFSCEAMWQGIDLRGVLRLKNTKIEDATRAVKSLNTKSLLYVENCTFNRNEIAIMFRRDSPQASNSYIMLMKNNTFTCDAPLNGTVSGKSLGAINLKNVNLEKEVTDNNKMQGMSLGIWVEDSELVTVGGSRFDIQDMDWFGITMPDGSVDVDESQFVNCSISSIRVDFARRVSIKNSNFQANDLIFDPTNGSPNGLEDWYETISLAGFAPNSYVNIDRNNFHTGLPVNHQMRNIALSGGNIGGGTVIAVTNSAFNLSADKLSNCIKIEGSYPLSSNIYIWGNKFSIHLETISLWDTGAIELSGGEKNNFIIYENDFDTPYSYNMLGRAHGIRLRGSTGINNQLGPNNTFPVDYSIVDSDYIKYATGVNIGDFENVNICSNIFSENGISIISWYENFNTSIDNNLFIGGFEAIRLAFSIIGPQWHKGNKFYHKWPNVYPSFGFIQCIPESNANENLFTVHTPQSTEYLYETPWYFNYSEYHPWFISPDPDVYLGDTGELFDTDATGTPSTGCAGQMLTGGGTNGLYESIADGTFNANNGNPQTIWSGKRHLFKKLKDNPELLTQYAGYAGFLTLNENTNIGAFYNVHQLIETSSQLDPTLNISHLAALANFNNSVDNVTNFLSNNSSAEPSLLDSPEFLTLTTNQTQAENAIKNLETNIKQARLSKLTQAHQLLQNIVTTETYENNLKSYFEILLSSILFQNQVLTSAQISQLQGIASQCSDNGGIAVYYANGLLPECYRENNQCEIYELSPPNMIELIEGRNAITNGQAPSEFDLKITPNPNQGQFDFIFSKPVEGIINIYDLVGTTLYQSKLSGTRHAVNLDVSAGTYFFTVILEDKQVQFGKFVVIQ